MHFQEGTIVSPIKRLYEIFNREQKKDFAILVFITFLGSLADLLGLSLLVPILGLVLSESFHDTFIRSFPILAGLDKRQLLVYTIAVFFIIILIKNLFTLYINKLHVRFVKRFYAASSLNMLDKIYSRSFSDIQSEHSNTLINKLTYMQSMLGNMVAIPALVVINEMMVIVISAIAITIWNWKLMALLTVVLAPTIGLFYFRVRKIVRLAGKEKNQEMINLYSHSQKMIFGYTDIKIAGTENKFRDDFKKLVNNFATYQEKTDFLVFVPSKIIEVAIFLCAAIILLYGVFVWEDLNRIIATIGLFSVVAYRITPSINRIVTALNNINMASLVINDPDFTIMEHRADIPALPLSFNDTIKFDHVHFRYPDTTHDVLKDCTMEIGKGEKIGIIGKSGAGKTTLMRHLTGYLQPTRGNILIDEQVLDKAHLASWWKLLGYVRQDVFIMNTTLMENIAIGVAKDKIDMERLHKAIVSASLSEFVNTRPEGVETIITESGNNLSGGQKQRIAIARALYKGAEVLLFDEATSSLDSQTEHEITESIRQLGEENFTIIIIAHRHTSLRYCDKIYELEDGHISRIYSYKELAAKEETT